ncbi:MAG: vWA domain-containing protein [Candidatus Acidiferrales bacterium]
MLSSFARTICAALILSAPWFPSRAQEPCPRTLIPTSFLDSQFRAITDVLPADIEGRFHGKSVKITSIAPDRRLHRAILLLDSSGSMSSLTGGISKWDVAVAVADDFFNQYASSAEVALSTFNADISVLAGFSSDNSSVRATLQELSTNHVDERVRVRGLTFIRKAVLNATRQFGHPGPADSIILITDGRETPGGSSDKLADALAAGMVRLFIVFVSEPIGGPTPEEMASPEELSEIAVNSGGGVLAGVYADGRSIHLTAAARNLASLPQDDSYGRPSDAWNQPTGRRLNLGQPLDLNYDAVLRDDLVGIQIASSDRSARLKMKFTKEATHRWKDPQITYPRYLPACSAAAAPPKAVTLDSSHN